MSIEAMRQALEALDGLSEPYDVLKAQNALRAAIEQSEKQEPVAWMTFDAAGEEDDIWYDNPDGKLLEGWTYKPLYTSPRQWQGLTDEDRDEILSWVEWKLIGNEYVAPQKIIAYVEKKLREKNNG